MNDIGEIGMCDKGNPEEAGRESRWCPCCGVRRSISRMAHSRTAQNLRSCAKAGVAAALKAARYGLDRSIDYLEQEEEPPAEEPTEERSPAT